MVAKKDILNSLSEQQFREEVLIPLLKRMGFENVRLHHGPEEYGKDITYRQPSPLGATYYAVVAKVGDIMGRSSGKPTNLLMTIKEQVQQAFSMPITDVTNDQGNKVAVNQVVVWTTGRISGNAESQIADGLDPRFKNNVRFLDGSATIEYLEKFYPSYFTINDASISNYFEKAKAKYGKLEELLAIGGTNAQKPLPSIFVAPTFKRIYKIRSKQAQKEGQTGKQYSFSKLIEYKGNTAIIGEMGSGKSTTLRKILLSKIEINERELSKYPIPVLIRFRKLILTGDKPIQAEIENQYNDLSEDQSPRDIEEDLNNGNIILLIDGLDELENNNEITAAMDAVKKFSQLYPKVRIIISSRMLEIFRTTDLLDGFVMFKIEEFSIHQMKQLLVNWFETEPATAKHLIKLITEPVAYSTIPFTPLTLALVAVLYQSGFTDMPANLTELFEKYTELALGRWDTGKDLASQIDWKKKDLVLRKLAWEMLGSTSTEFSSYAMQSYIDKLIVEHGLVIDIDPFFKELIGRSGLFIKNADGNYEFKHRAFMDYFAGSELNTKTGAVDLVIQNFSNPRWSRVVFFACGLKPDSDGENYVKAIMSNIDIKDCGSFQYAFQLGLLAQATYLAHTDTKIEAAKRVLLCFVDAWDDLAKNFRDAYVNGKVRRPIPHLVLLYIYRAAVGVSLGSTTLSVALSKITSEILENTSNSKDISPDERVKQEWIVFSLAISCANANNVDDFIELVSSNIVTDPALLLLIKEEAEYLCESEWISSTDKTNLTELIKKLDRKLAKNKKYLDKVATQQPMLLATETEKEN